MIGLRVTLLSLGCGLLLASCDDGRGDAETGMPAMRDTAAMGEMSDMPGMQGMPGMSSGMIDQMTTHMQAMHGASADSIREMLPLHRQMLANMIAHMNREMRDMNMTSDAQWNATVDSLRSDLTRLPEMGGTELHAYMPEHHQRVTRLMEMHRAMMRHMNM